jgi:hypothetical protein
LWPQFHDFTMQFDADAAAHADDHGLSFERFEPLFKMLYEIRCQDLQPLRRYASLPRTTLKQVAARLNVIKLQLEELLSSCEPPAVSFPRIDPAEQSRGASEVAYHVRRLWRIPDGPIKNLVQRVESAGCIVIEFDFGSRKIDGTGDFVSGVPSSTSIRERIPFELALPSLTNLVTW